MLSEGAHEGMEVRVLRGDKRPFNEHDVVHRPGSPGHPPTTVCWLEIEQDATFLIEIRLHKAILSNYHSGDYFTWTWIDGSTVRKASISDTDQFNRVRQLSKLAYDGPEGLMKGAMRFSQLRTADQLSDTNRRINDDENTSIQVDIEAGTKGVIKRMPQVRTKYAFGTDGGVALEEEAKRTDSSVILHDPKPVNGINEYAWYPLDDQTPYHRFIFKYRTRAILESLDIIKPDIPTTSEPDLATQDSTRLGPSQNTQNENSSVASQVENLKVIRDMRRELSALRRTVARHHREQGRGESQVVDLTGDDSD